MNKKNNNPLIRAVKKKLLPDLLKQYLHSCAEETDTMAKKGTRPFPNLAGFCRTLGCGPQAFSQLAEAYPTHADWLTAVFEDEVLRREPSPTVLTAYLKRRLGYADKTKAEETEADCGLMRLVFEHDITEDGE